VEGEVEGSQYALAMLRERSPLPDHDDHAGIAGVAEAIEPVDDLVSR